MDIADSVIRNYRLEGTHFPVSMLINHLNLVHLVGTQFWSSSHLALDNPIIYENRVNVVTDRLKLFYCLINEIIKVVLAYHC